MKNKIPEVVFSAVIASVPLSFFVWIGIVVRHFELKRPYAKPLFKLMQVAFSDQRLTWITYGCLLGVFTICALLSYLYHSSAGSKLDHHIRGSKILDPKKLKLKIEKEKAKEEKKEEKGKKEKKSDKQEKLVTLADIPIPLRLETLHFLIGGRTGTGKTAAIKEMLSRMIPRGDRVIVTDPNGDFLSHFYKKGDILLNPFDLRGQEWSIFNELDSQYDHERYAKSVIPPARSLQDSEWHGYAQLLFSETTKKLFKEKQYTTKALIEWLTLKPVDELSAFLSGTAAAGLFDPGAAKALASTRFIITHYIAPHQYLKPGTFSLKSWLKNEKGGNLYITWREDMAEALRPLISTWLDILCTSILSLPPSENRRIWIIIDELASLERLNSLEAALTKGRKHGLRIVTGLQSTAQLDHLYGREKAIALRSCFSNILILGGTSSDSQTAEDFSKGLGEQDIERVQTSTTQTRQGRNKTESKQRLKERIVLPSEITHLPPLTGYLSLAGDYPISKVALKIPSLCPVTSRFEE